MNILSQDRTTIVNSDTFAISIRQHDTRDDLVKIIAAAGGTSFTLGEYKRGYAKDVIKTIFFRQKYKAEIYEMPIESGKKYDKS